MDEVTDNHGDSFEETLNLIFYHFCTACSLDERFELIDSLTENGLDALDLQLRKLIEDDSCDIDQAFLEWNLSVLDAGRKIRRMSEPERKAARKQKATTFLQKTGLKIGILAGPETHCALLIKEIEDSITHWNWNSAQMLMDGAKRAFGYLLAWLALGRPVPSDSVATLKSTRAFNAHLDPNIHLLLPIEAPARLFLQTSTEIYYKTIGLFYAKHLCESGEPLAAAALCASVFRSERLKSLDVKLEVGKAAMSYLDHVEMRDTSSVLLLQLMFRAVYDLNTSQVSEAAVWLDRAIGESRALAQRREYTSDFRFHELCADLHLDRAIAHLDSKKGRYWKSLEDYAKSIEWHYSALNLIPDESFSAPLKKAIGSTLMMQYVAKKASNVYAPEQLINDLSSAIAIAEGLGNDRDLLRHSLLQRSRHLLEQNYEFNAQALSDITRTINLFHDEDETLAEAYHDLGCYNLGASTSIGYKEAASCFEKSIGYYSTAYAKSRETRSVFHYARGLMNLALAWTLDPDRPRNQVIDAYSLAASTARDFLSMSTSTSEEGFQEISKIYAVCFLHMGVAYASLGRFETAEATINQGIEVLEGAYNDDPSRYGCDWLDDLASCYFNRSNVRAALGLKVGQMADLDRAIDIRRQIIRRFRNSERGRSICRLASTMIHRAGVIAENSGSGGTREAISDCSTAIELLSLIPREESFRAYVLEMVYRAHALLADYHEKLGDHKAAILASELGASAVDRLRELRWIQSNHLDFDVAHARRLAHSGKYAEAEARLRHVSVLRDKFLAFAVTRTAKKTFIADANEVGALGAWVIANSGRPDEALSFVEENRTFLLRQAILSDATVLATRSGRSITEAEVVEARYRELEASSAPQSC